MPVTYTFIYDKNGKMSLDSCDEVHNHHLQISTSELTRKMHEDIQLYHKRSRIIDIKESIEQKYKVLVDHHIIYSKFNHLLNENLLFHYNPSEPIHMYLLI